MPNTTTNLHSWMRLHVSDHVDPLTGEVNCTALAEAAADHFDLFEDRRDWRPTEDCFDAACEVAWEVE